MSNVFNSLMQKTLVVTDTELNALKDKFSEKYNMDELGSILDSQGNNLTVAAAGSGKTTSLLLKLVIDDKANFGQGASVLKRRPRVWVSTFLKAGADDLKIRLHELSLEYGHTPTSDILCSTLHSVYFKIVKQLEPSLEIISETDKAKYLHEAFEIPKDEDGRERLSKIISILTLMNNLENKDDARINDAIVDSGYTIELFNEYLQKYKNKKLEKKVFDFDDLQWIIYRNACLKKNESFIRLLQDMFDVFYLDEFQDISPVQYAILKVQSAKALKVFAIGDDDQSIYGWRGSDNDIIINQFKKDFDPEITHLSINYRCPETILKPALNVIDHNVLRHKKDIKAHKEGGDFKVKSFNNASLLTKHLVNDIKEHVYSGNKLTVLSRTNSSAYLTLLYLEADGSLDYGYFGSPINLMSSSVSKYMQAPMAVDGLVASIRSLGLIFSAFDIKLSWNKLKQIASYLRGSNYTLITLPKDSMRHLGIFTPELYSALQAIKMGTDTTINFTLRILGNKYSDTHGYTLLAGIIDAFDIETTEHLILVLNKLKKKFTNRYKAEGEDLIITTIHGYKGLENDHVFIAPVCDGIMPNRYNKTEGKMMGDNLTPELAQSLLEEERRLFYIACTRAKKSCSVYSLGHDNLFINELGMPIDYITDLPNEEKLNKINMDFLDLSF